MRTIQSILLSILITVSMTGCVMVLGVDDFPSDSKIIIIDDELYVVDQENKKLKLIEGNVKIEIDESDSDD
jgi:hypothetical protein